MFPGFDRCTIAIAGARGQSNEHSVLVAFDPCPADDKIANFDLVLHLWTMIHPDLPAQAIYAYLGLTFALLLSSLRISEVLPFCSADVVYRRFYRPSCTSCAPT